MAQLLLGLFELLFAVDAFEQFDRGIEVRLALDQFGQARTLLAFDQHTDGAIGEFQQLQHRGDDAQIIERVAIGIILGRIELCHQEDRLVRRHRGFERRHRFLAADEQRHDHMGEHDDVAQRQKGQCLGHLVSRGGLGVRRFDNLYGRAQVHYQ